MSSADATARAAAAKNTVEYDVTLMVVLVIDDDSDAR